MPAVCYRARVVCPMTGPPIADGAVLVDGERIVRLDTAGALVGEADRVHEIDGVLLPALVNGRTVLEHADAADLAVPGPAHRWREVVAERTGNWTRDAWTRSARRGVQLALRSGTGALVDVVIDGPGVPAAARTGLRGDSLVEVAGVDRDHLDAVLREVEHALGLPAPGRRVGIAPAGPAEVSTGALQALGVLGDRAGVPVQIAAARSFAEVAAIREATGPLADAARAKGLEHEWLQVPTGLTPIRYLDACGLLRPQTSVAHAIHVDVLEARLLTERRACVVLCPRADDLQQAGAAPLERYAEAGTPLALGTGSPAAIDSLDLLAEASAFVALARDRGLAMWSAGLVPAGLEEQAVRLITVDGARALGWDDVGVLQPGGRADLVGVALDTDVDSVYRDLVERGPGRQVLTVLGGVRRARRDDPDRPWPPIERLEA